MHGRDEIEAKPRDRWVGVGLVDRIEPASSHPIIVEGRELALWRGESGSPGVWDDRCPHRGMRLSLGFVRGDTLRCLYHGWAYGENGRCVAIPAHPDLTPPKTICASVHGVAEKYGIIWANLSPTRTAPLPVLPTEAGWHPVRSLSINRPMADIFDGIAAFDYGERASVTTRADNICVLAVGSDTQLLFAIQPVDPVRTGLHVAVAQGNAPSIPRRQLLARQMARLRGAIEAVPSSSQKGQIP